MKAALTSSLSLLAIVLTVAPADAERPKPRRVARAALVRHAAPAPVAPLDVAAGCVPVWVVEGRQTRRLPDRCPKPQGAPTAGALASAPPAAAVNAAAPRRAAKKKPPAKCARFRTWIDANGVRRSSPACS